LEYNAGSISGHGLGVQLLSQNILSTLQLSAGYRHVQGNAEQVYFANATYTGFFPVLSTEFTQGYQTIYDEPQTDERFDYDTIPAADFFMKRSLSSVDIPLNFSSRAYHRYLNIGAGFQFYAYDKIFERPDTVDFRFPKNGQNSSFVYSLQFVNQRHSVARDMGPRWAQMLSLGYTHGLFDSKYVYSDGSLERGIAAQSVFGTAKFYFPGIFYHHSFQLFANYSWRNDETNYTYYDLELAPRGYLGKLSDYTQMYSLQTSYAFPLLYPDLTIGPLFYITRIRMLLFADFAVQLDSPSFMFYLDPNFDTYNHGLYTYGFECIGDMHVFRTLHEFSLVFRYATVCQTKKQSIEFVLQFGVGL